MMRSILTVLAGLVAGSLVIFGLEWLGHRIEPPPVALDGQDMEALKAYVASAPPKVFLLLLGAWAGGAFAGGLVAGLVAARHRVKHALVVGAVQTALAGLQLAMIPHPAWVAISGLALFIPFAWLGGRLFGDVPDAPA